MNDGLEKPVSICHRILHQNVQCVQAKSVVVYMYTHTHLKLLILTHYFQFVFSTCSFFLLLSDVIGSTSVGIISWSRAKFSVKKKEKTTENVRKQMS